MSVPSSQVPRIAWTDSITVEDTIDEIRRGDALAGHFFMYPGAKEPSTAVQYLSWETWNIYLSQQCAFSTTEHLLKYTINEKPIYIFQEIQWKSTISRLITDGKEIVFEIVSKKGKHIYIPVNSSLWLWWIELIAFVDTYAKAGHKLLEPEPAVPKPAVVGPRSPVFGDPYRSLLGKGYLVPCLVQSRLKFKLDIWWGCCRLRWYVGSIDALVIVSTSMHIRYDLNLNVACI